MRAAAALPAHMDWLHHRLDVSGPPADLAAFRQAAAGTGTVPWHLDLGRMEEDWFHRLASPGRRTLSLQGARVLAGQLREAVERRHALALARVGRGTACPFDLHALVPVPPAILRLGPDDPEALTWLWANWGTTEPLRHVRADPGPGRAQDQREIWRLGFWSADWTPWRALHRIRSDWPTLCLDARPAYDDR